MPALPAVPGVVKVTLPYTLTSDPDALSRIFIHYTGTAPTPSQLQTFCVNVANAQSAQFAALMTSLYKFGLVNAEDLSSASGAVATDTASHAGTRAGGVLAPGTALMTQFSIARRYRGGKPKIFQPFGVTSDIDVGSVWTSALVSSVGTAWAAFIASVVGAGWAAAGTLTHVNVSYYSGFTVVTNPTTHRARNVPTLRGSPVVDPITAYAVEVGLASQRRRNRV